MPSNSNPILKPITEHAKLAIGSASLIIDATPYRLGRESRKGGDNGWLGKRRVPRSKPSNECYMRDHGPLKQISREHFVIQRTDAGGYQLSDRGSRCGTRVNDTTYGKQGGSKKCALKNGDVIVVGSSESPYVFVFVEPQSAEPVQS